MNSGPPTFSLQRDIRVADLQSHFERHGWVQLQPFLEENGAAALRDHLLGRDDWRLSYRVGDGPPFRLDREARRALSDNQREAIHKLVAPSEERGFRYLFEEITAVSDDLIEREPSTLLGQFARFLSSEPVLELVREITGAEDISNADARGTLYAPGHFLTMHDDEVEGVDRRAAYVFGLTPSWRPEWGGLLLFHDANGNVEHGLMPRMNALNLFQVPKRHSVSLVAPFAPVPRYSVTGWLLGPRRS